MSDPSDDDKQHEPTQKKLDDARKKGEIPRSVDANTALAYAGLLLAAMTVGGSSLTSVGTALAALLDHADSISTSVFRGGAAPTVGGLILSVASGIGPLILVPAGLVLLALIGQRGIIFAPSRLAPKASRISPLAQAKNKFGRAGLFEFTKSFVKLLIYSIILFIYLAGQLPRIMSTSHLEPGLVTTELLRLTLGLLGLVLVVAAILGVIDFVWQRAEHTRRNMMSRKELTDEQKDAEGDPAMKQQRRQKAVDIALNQMLQDVPGADVVIVNPTHYAVALSWDRASSAAPVCVAKGVDEIAMRIRQVAMECGVPIRSDPPTARALHATVEIGQQIRPDQYRAVAIAIRFAEKIRRKARQ